MTVFPEPATRRGKVINHRESTGCTSSVRLPWIHNKGPFFFHDRYVLFWLSHPAVPAYRVLQAALGLVEGFGGASHNRSLSRDGSCVGVLPVLPSADEASGVTRSLVVYVVAKNT
jgi:hypothetical protein